jgi:hypothetical protein
MANHRRSEAIGASGDLKTPKNNADLDKNKKETPLVGTNTELF